MKKLDRTTILNEVTKDLTKAQRYSVLAFLIFVVIIYGFVLFRFNSLRNQEPSPDAVSSQIKSARVPHIDEEVVQQLQSLEDNSVNVQALFNQARSNPFR